MKPQILASKIVTRIDPGPCLPDQPQQARLDDPARRIAVRAGDAAGGLRHPRHQRGGEGGGHQGRRLPHDRRHRPASISPAPSSTSCGGAAPPSRRWRIAVSTESRSIATRCATWCGRCCATRCPRPCREKIAAQAADARGAQAEEAATAARLNPSLEGRGRRHHDGRRLAASCAGVHRAAARRSQAGRLKLPSEARPHSRPAPTPRAPGGASASTRASSPRRRSSDCGQGGTQLVVGQGVVVTPLARDKARAARRTDREGMRC